MSGEVTLTPIQLEVLWNRLLSVCNEQQTTLVRTAFSTIVRESLDLACGVFDTRGNMIGQSLTGTPGHINPMATGAIHLLNAYPPESLKPGDVLVTNDPWLTAGQVNDFTVLSPVFRGNKIVAYFSNCCHSPDIGGRILSAEAHEVFEEGLQVPITKLFCEGEPNEELFKIIRANVRTPDETIGDLYAQAACNDVGARSLVQMMDEFELQSIDPLADEIIARSEQAMRDGIRGLTNGRYEHETWSDGYEEPLCIKVAVTIEDEDIFIDFTGSSAQSQRGINVVLNYTKGYASFAMKAAISPEVPHNEGAFRPVHITAPEGSILNCKRPAAVASRHLVGHFLPSAIFGALAQAIPERVMAGSADPIWMSIWRAKWPESERRANFTMFSLGGTGARPTKDGLNTTGFPSGVGGVPIEVFETQTPLLMAQKGLEQNSGGAGQFRGGLGQKMVVTSFSDEQWSVSGMVDRTEYPAPGLLDGKAGAKGQFLLDQEPSTAKQIHWMEPASTITMKTPGGGGFYSPFERSVESVLEDVVNGYVSIASAESDYGVVIQCTAEPDALVKLPGDFIVDEKATATLRG